METIKSKLDFERVFSKGERFSAPLVRITVLRDDEGGSGRVAFVAAKRLGNAVYRNRCKRLLREAARDCHMPRENLSIILFATNRTHEAHPRHIAKDLERLLGRLGS